MIVLIFIRNRSSVGCHQGQSHVAPSWLALWPRPLGQGQGHTQSVASWDHEPPDPDRVFVNLNPFQQPHGEGRAEWDRPLPGGREGGPHADAVVDSASFWPVQEVTGPILLFS